MNGRSSRIDRKRGASLRACVVVLAGAAMTLAGCASLPGAQGRVAMEPMGPGTVFPTIEDAVVDAMAYSVADARSSARSDRMYGGVIRMVEDGYTYGEPVVATSWKPLDVRYSVSSADVARYHVYPVADDVRENQRREHATRVDRLSVDQRDPRRRTLYFLTPSMVVKAYHGARVPEQEVVRLDRSSDGVLVVQNTGLMP